MNTIDLNELYERYPSVFICILSLEQKKVSPVQINEIIPPHAPQSYPP